MLPPSRRLGAAFVAALLLLVLARVINAAEPGALSSGYSTDTSSTSASPAVTSGTGESLGLGQFGRFPFRFTVAVQSGYDDNVFTNNVTKQGSAFTNASIGATYQFGSPRTEIELRTGGGLTYYYDRPQQKDPDYNAFLGLMLKHKFSARLSLQIDSYTAYQIEPDFSLNIGVNRRSGSYFYSSDHFTLTFLFTPRFSTATSYTVTTLLYGNTTAGDFQNRVENTVGNEFRFLVLPTTTLVGEYRIEYISYLDSNNDSLTNFFLLGADHNFSPRLLASLRGGVELREFEGSTLTTGGSGSSEASPYFETTVSYTFPQKDEASWTMRYGIQEPDLPTNPRRTTFRTGLNASIHLSPRITARFAGYYQHDNYDSQGFNAAFTEDAFDLSLTLRYALSRYLGFEVGYSHTEALSDVQDREYARNRIYAGLDLVF